MTRLRNCWDVTTLLTLAVLGQLAYFVFGNCGGIYYYAALAGMSMTGGHGNVIGAFQFMCAISRGSRTLAVLAHEMQKEIDIGEHPEVVRDYYARLHAVAVEVAEAREPGVIRRAWEMRQKRE